MKSHRVAESNLSRHVGVVNELTLASVNVASAPVIEQAVKVEALMALMRKTGDLMTPQALQLIMRIYIEPGATMQTLEDRTKMSLASVSRNLMALGEWHRLGKPGLGLVETVDDPHERRRKIAFLTRKGRHFVEEVLSIGRKLEDWIEVEAPTANEFLNRAYRSGR